MITPQRILSRIGHELRLLRLKAGMRLLGANGFEYWGRLQDDSVRGIEPEKRPNTWGPRAQRQFDFLKSIGLKPHHRFLDYGCARVATGEELIPWFEREKYVGCDVAASSMHWAQHRLTAKGIERSRYHLICVRSPELTELEGFTFDFIWAFSVLQFLPERDLRRVLERFTEMIAPGGIICVTYSVEEDREILQRKKMHVHGLDVYKSNLKGFDCRTEKPYISNSHVNIALFTAP